jgi:chaperonin cofactor prefoldin
MTDIAELERRVSALEAQFKQQKNRDDRIMQILTELKEDSALLRRHAIASGQKIEDLDSRISALDSRVSALEGEMKAMRSDIAALPGIIIDAMREVLREQK